MIRKELNMGALMMFGLVSLIAIVAFLYYYHEEKMEKKA